MESDFRAHSIQIAGIYYATLIFNVGSATCSSAVFVWLYQQSQIYNSHVENDVRSLEQRVPLVIRAIAISITKLWQCPTKKAVHDQDESAEIGKKK